MEQLENYINEKNVVNQEFYNEIKDSIICPICKDLMINPMMCMNCQNCFCKKCIQNWASINKRCPNRCQNPGYKRSIQINQLLSKLKIKCIRCNSTFNYDEMIKHFYSKCGTEKIDMELYNIDNSPSINGIFQKLEEKKEKNGQEYRIKSKLKIIF